MFYTTGEEVHLNDRIRYRGSFGTVVVVCGGGTSEYAPGFSDYSGYDRGIIITDDDGVVSSLTDTDPELEFVDRA